MEKLLDYVLKNLKTNLREVIMVGLAFMCYWFFEADRKLIEKSISAIEADNIFYRRKADSLQNELSDLKAAFIKAGEEEVQYLREENERLKGLIKK